MAVAWEQYSFSILPVVCRAVKSPKVWKQFIENAHTLSLNMLEKKKPYILLLVTPTADYITTVIQITTNTSVTCTSCLPNFVKNNHSQQCIIIKTPTTCTVHHVHLFYSTGYRSEEDYHCYRNHNIKFFLFFRSHHPPPQKYKINLI